ncbi:MAG: hypothetical protein HY692_00745 [Cyanobacteria bacterium NC_groundwater_1444_Ag_S-0.65um_54_12]|nr:hypothetical protein [Cyanobacteria bacterium NC_groundwater_1444_Ag_S-0.65um_54_12]
MSKFHLGNAAICALMASGCGLSVRPELSPAALPSNWEAHGKNLVRPDLPRGKEERSAVLLSYLPIDDPMENHVPVYLNVLERTTSERVYNVAFTDMDGRNNTFAYRIVSDNTERVVSLRSQPAPGITEMTTNNPEVLQGAVTWAYSSYPGKLKAFSYLGHGGGYLGIATDNTPGKEKPPDQAVGTMTVADFGTAIKKGLKGRKLSIMYLHACLMANLEAAYELRDAAEVLVASEDFVGSELAGTEKSTEIFNSRLQASPADPRQIGRDVVIQLRARQNSHGFLTATALDLDRIAEIKRSVNSLSRALLIALPQHRSAIATAYESVPNFYRENKTGWRTGQRDLWTFCKRLQQVPDRSVQQSALAVVQAIRQALLHTRDGEGDAAQSLSIFMPTKDSMVDRADQAYRATRFARDCAWDEFLAAFHGWEETPVAGNDSVSAND